VKNISSTFKQFNRVKKIFLLIWSLLQVIPPKPFVFVTASLLSLPVEMLLFLPVIIEQALTNADINTLRGFVMDPNVSMEQLTALGERCGEWALKRSSHPIPGDRRWRSWNGSMKYEGIMKLCALRNPRFASSKFYKKWIDRYGE